MRRASAAIWRKSGAAYTKYHSLQRKISLTSPTIQITTLPNKIRVATDNTPGHFSSVGLYVDAGTRHETLYTSGASYFLDRMAFKSTANRSVEQMTSAIDSLGGQIMCSSSRESITYQSSHAHKSTPLSVSLIADTVINPAFKREELERQRDAAAYELREMKSKPEMILPEITHSVAYNNRGLGNTVFWPEERLDEINADLLRHAMQEWYRPEKMVVAGAGMPHDELVELTDRFFSSFKSSTFQSHLTSSAGIPKSPTSTYTGGHRFIPDTKEELNHLYIAFEGPGVEDDDIYPLAVMQVLLGGGGSFSAGGPGKGMYSRLYTHILNHYSQIDHCASFHHIYTDSSLFGLFASFVPAASGVSDGGTPGQILPHLIHQLSLLLYSIVPPPELKRAQNQLTSSLMMALESRPVQVEDLGRQILVHNRQIPVTEMTDRINQVTAADIRRVAERVFSPHSGSKPTVVCMGHEDVGDSGEVFSKYGLAG